MRTSLRAVLAVACLVGFYAVAIAGVAGLAFLAVHTVLDSGPGRAAAVTVALLGFALIAVHTISRGLRRAAPSLPGVVLEQEGHPDLYAEVADLARRVGTRAPDEIRLVPEPAVHVVEEAGRLGLAGGPRRMLIGVPLLITLDRSEMHAVMAHQLAHFRPGFLGACAVAYRGQLTLGALAQREQDLTPLAVLVKACARVYLRVAAPVSRHQEVVADELAAHVGGSAAAILLLRTSLGRHREEALLQRSDDELVTLSRADLAAALGVTAAPVDTHVQRWGGALPQYALGHLARVARVRAAVEEHPGLAVCGATYDGVGIPAVIASARVAASGIR